MTKHNAPQPKAKEASKSAIPPSAAHHPEHMALFANEALWLKASRALRPFDAPRNARDLYREAIEARLGMNGGEKAEIAGEWLLWALGGGLEANELWEAMFNLADDLNVTADLHACLGLEEALPTPLVSRLAGLAERARIIARLHHDALERMEAVTLDEVTA